ncbi:MAG: hypothetical protein KC502_08945 [Myxococcales bacterium]|nr:hypothetical protein [Myxococcales bacterium]
MKNKSIEQLRGQFGLPSEPVGDAALGAATSDAAHGLAPSLVSLRDFAAGDVDSQPVLSSLTTDLGLVVERAQLAAKTLIFSARSTTDDALVVEYTGAAALERDEGDTEVYLKLEPGGSATISSGTLGTLLLTADADGSARAWSFAKAPWTVAPFATLEVSVSQWLQPTSPPWLTALVGAADKSGDPLRQLCAAGVIHRLDEAPSAKAQLQALLSGDGLPSGPVAWASELSSAQRETVVDLGRVGLESLLDEIEALDHNDLDDDTAVTSDDLIALLHWRDDLEGARVLLAAEAGLSGLELLFELVDRAGSRLLRSLDHGPLPADPRLHRAHAVMPEAWWSAEDVR